MKNIAAPATLRTQRTAVVALILHMLIAVTNKVTGRPNINLTQVKNNYNLLKLLALKLGYPVPTYLNVFYFICI